MAKVVKVQDTVAASAKYVSYVFQFYILESKNEKRSKTEALDPMDPAAYADVPRYSKMINDTNVRFQYTVECYYPLFCSDERLSLEMPAQ